MNLPIVYHHQYVVHLPDGHRFPMEKFALLYQLLLKDKVVDYNNIYCPELTTQSLLELVHCTDYITAYCQGSLTDKAQRRIGFPWSEALVKRTCIAVGGTILTAKLALKFGMACNTAGGTHHAFPDYGSGFCIFNDLAIATRVLQKLNLVKTVLIID